MSAVEERSVPPSLTLSQPSRIESLTHGTYGLFARASFPIDCDSFSRGLDYRHDVVEFPRLGNSWRPYTIEVYVGVL